MKNKDNILMNSDELQVKMKINKNNNIKPNNKKKINISDDIKIKEFMKNQNSFDKLLLSFFKEQKEINKKLEIAILKNSNEIKIIKKELLMIKKLIIKKQ